MTQTERRAATRKERLEAAKTVEDRVNEAREGKDDLWKAIMYQVLHSEGINLEKAHDIKVRAGLSE